LPHAWGLPSRLAVALLLAATTAGVGAGSSASATNGPPPASATTTTAPPPVSKAWILVDADTGNVVDAGNDRTPLPPASLTKVITALTASNLTPDTPVAVSARAEAAPADKLFMKAGQIWTADEMLHALLISSANDAAVALAEKVGGSLESYQPIFAATALGLGMADHPVLMDPAGLDGPDGVDGGNLVSARDLAMAGRTLLAVPPLAAIAATPVYYFDGPDKVHHRLTNHNKLFLTTYAGAVGIKTGYTKRAGACLMAAARVGGRTMLAVVLNSTNPTAAVKRLLDQGFATPASAEITTDQLPAVNLAALNPANVALPVRSGAGVGAGSAPPGAGATGAGATGAGTAGLGSAGLTSPTSPAPAATVVAGHIATPPWWLLAVAGGLVLCLALAVGSRPGRRRRRRG
jgi:D-alanyl-D-alanine carboxypeptidase (penicillin-binding protein 5/6)